MRADKRGLAGLRQLRAQHAATPALTPAVSRKHAARIRGRAPGAAAAGPVPEAPTETAPTPAPTPEATLTAEDRALFRRAVKAVQPLKDQQRASLPPARREPLDLLRQRRELAMGQEAPKLSPVSDHYTPAQLKQEDGSFLQSGYGPDLLKGLKRGKWAIEASLDLHGSTLDEARERLEQFLQSCLTHRVKCVRVVHGKGYGSKDGASVLRQTVRRWLSQMEAVKAYADCREQDGGSGAVQALLRVAPNPK